MPRSDLPFGSEFSPAQIDLPVLLELASEHQDDWHALSRLFEIVTSPDTRHLTTTKSSSPTTPSCPCAPTDSSVGRTSPLTDTGRALYDLSHDEAALYQAFARHILKYRHGMNFVQCLLDMQAAGETINLNTLRLQLKERGIDVPRGGKHMSTSVYGSKRRASLLLATVSTKTASTKFSGLVLRSSRPLPPLLQSSARTSKLLPTWRAEARTLRTISKSLHPPPMAPHSMRRVCPNRFSIPQGCWLCRSGTGYQGNRARGKAIPGHGNRIANVRPHHPASRAVGAATHANLRPLLRKSLKEIRESLNSPDRHIRGLALEALAFKLMRLIDLSYVATRLRSAATGGAEWILSSRAPDSCSLAGRFSARTLLAFHSTMLPRKLALPIS